MKSRQTVSATEKRDQYCVAYAIYALINGCQTYKEYNESEKRHMLDKVLEVYRCLPEDEQDPFVIYTKAIVQTAYPGNNKINCKSLQSTSKGYKTILTRKKDAYSKLLEVVPLMQKGILIYQIANKLIN